MPDADPKAPDARALVADAWARAHELAEAELGPSYPRHFTGAAGGGLLADLYGLENPTAEGLAAVVRGHVDGLKAPKEEGSAAEMPGGAEASEADTGTGAPAP